MSAMAPMPEQPAAVVATKTPESLTTAERWWAGALAIFGGALLVGILVWFALSTGGELVSKTTEVSEPAGGAKTTTTTEYSDEIVIFGLTAGTGLLLAGAFYGRLRELKLGALTLGLGELPPQKQKALVEKVTEKIERMTDDPGQARVLAAAAQMRAQQMFRSAYWGVVPSPPDDYLEQIAGEAANDVLREARVAPGEGQ